MVLYHYRTIDYVFLDHHPPSLPPFHLGINSLFPSFQCLQLSPHDAQPMRLTTDIVTFCMSMHNIGTRQSMKRLQLYQVGVTILMFEKSSTTLLSTVHFL